MDYPDYVFKCRKCGHLLFLEDVDKLLLKDCPECGEESYENWIFKRRGNYEEEYGGK